MAERDTFLISVDTRDKPGFLEIVTVTIRKEVVSATDPAFAARTWRVDLKDHPLFPHVVAYVKDNGGEHG